MRRTAETYTTHEYYNMYIMILQIITEFVALFFFFPSFTMLCMNTVCVIYIYGFMLLKIYYAMLQCLQVSPLCFL